MQGCWSREVISLLSGFFEGDVPAMQSCVEAAGLRVEGVKVLEGWACMACWKPA